MDNKDYKKKICILGLGYIGLPTAAMFASCGHNVVGVDINKKIVDLLNEGTITICEPGLDILIKEVVDSKMLTGSLSPCEADVFIISVPTPICSDKTADMSYVIAACESIVEFVRPGNIIILESTSPPQTVEKILMPILVKSGLALGSELFVAHSPERVLPGKILHELVFNDRIVGGINHESAILVRQLYESFVKGNIFLTDATTAEMCKLMENTFRDVNIALANELALICEDLGINAWDVINFSNKHPRVNVHQPGPGVGGHCIAVDPWFIVEKSPSFSNLIKLSRDINDNMPVFVYNKVLDILGNDYINKKVTIFGITYKPNVDDIRESPVLKIIELLKNSGIHVYVVDPYVDKDLFNTYSVVDAVCDSHLILLGVNHDEFADLDFNEIKNLMAVPNALDTRNFWSADNLALYGFNYFLLGKGCK